MEIRRICALGVVVLLSSLAVFASSVNDPKVIIHGASSTNAPERCPAQGCTNVGTHFTFNVPDNHKATGTLFFTNASGKNWTSLTLIEHGIPAASISCAQNLFLSCTTKTLPDGSVAIILAGVKGTKNPNVGIPAGSSFSIRFQCVRTADSEGCWIPGQSVTGQAGTSVPEPATTALLVTGLAATFFRRKTWKSR